MQRENGAASRDDARGGVEVALGVKEGRAAISEERQLNDVLEKELVQLKQEAAMCVTKESEVEQLSHSYKDNSSQIAESLHAIEEVVKDTNRYVPALSVVRLRT